MVDGPLEVVTFSPTDPGNPKNWSKGYKHLNVAMICLLVFVGVTGSSFYAPAEPQIRSKYGITPDVTSLGLSLYVLGFAFGPLICPISEMYGRRVSYLIAWPLFIATLAPSAWADNAAVIIFFRFWAGAAAGAPLNNGAAITADLYGGVDPQAQAVATSYFTFSAFCGPIIAPIAGFFLSTRYPNELWVLRLQFFMAVAIYPVVFLLRETHGPSILAARAKALRKSGHPQAWAAHELTRKTTSQLMRINLIRPSVMLYTEPIVMGASIWTGLSYGILYFGFESYPIVFLKQHNIEEKLGGLPFIPIVIGMLLAVVPYAPLAAFFQKLKLPKWMGDAGDTESPESRLKLALLACVCLPISTFWLAWTSGSETHWVVPVLSGIPFGFANITIFFTFVTYLVHTYGLYTASAIAVSTFVRSAVASIFPIVAHNILDRLGTKWGISLFGFFSLGLMPIPIIFIRHGKRLRATSRFAQEARALAQKMESASQDEADSSSSGPTQQGSTDVSAAPAPDRSAASEKTKAPQEQPHPALKALEEGTRLV